MAEHAVAVARGGDLRAPAGSDTCGQQLVGMGLVIPHGDPVDHAQSRDVVDEVEAAVGLDDHVVRVLVLRDDVGRRARRIE